MLTVTSGLVVTMRRANSVCSPWPRPISAKMSPNPDCVDTRRPATLGIGSTSGTCTAGADKHRPSGVSGRAKGLAATASRSAPSGASRPSKGSHSWPGRMPMAARKPSICSRVISPAWLSLCPANGSPMPLTV